MKMFCGFLTLLALRSLIFMSVLVHSQDDQSGFISIDCGNVGSSTYTDNVSFINYVSDAGFIDSGEMHNILPIYNLYGDVDTQLTTLTSHGTPFISAIKIRLLGNDMYKETVYGSLYLFTRVNFGTAYGIDKYNDDKYDRLWDRINLDNTTFLFTSINISTGLTTIYPPREVMYTAVTPDNPKDPFSFGWTPETDIQEKDKKKAKQQNQARDGKDKVKSKP
ncbi:leucine-rich repeat transmembrane protein kinase protein, partial [Tanacetum coccineum]